MQIIDNDLLSIQEARILSENAFVAQKEMASFSQEKLDRMVEKIAQVMQGRSQELAAWSVHETGFGNVCDEGILIRFMSQALVDRLRGMRCVGVVDEDYHQGIVEIGVPKGVILSVGYATNPIATLIYHALIAIKSGNAIIFTLHPRAKESAQSALESILAVLREEGFPEGAVGYLHTLSDEGTKALIASPRVATLFITEQAQFVDLAYQSGKRFFYGTTGNNPVFVEKTANLSQAAQDVIQSKTFNNGTVPGVEQSLVVETVIASAFRQELIRYGAYFMAADEEQQLAQCVFDERGNYKSEMIGKGAEDLARRAGIHVPPGTKVLVAEKKYISRKSPYLQLKYGPILAYYIEDDWEHACEKCIELLIGEGNGHSLGIFSKDENVILQFALRKPVARMLVNTPLSLGSIGLTSNLFPALTLGSGAIRIGSISGNLAPDHLVYRRKIAYGVRQLDPSAAISSEAAPDLKKDKPLLTPEMAEVLCKLLKKDHDSQELPKELTFIADLMQK